MSLDYTQDSSTQCTVTVKDDVLSVIDELVTTEKSKQPEAAKHINRSSTISILLAKQLIIMGLMNGKS